MLPLEMIAQATARGEVAVAEVDLNLRTHWISLGDFKVQLTSYRSASVFSPPGKD